MKISVTNQFSSLTLLDLAAGKGWQKQLKKEKTAEDIALYIYTQTKKAIYQYNMINEGDRVLVAVSGGKDSLTLLNTLIKIREKFPYKFDIGAVTIDPQTLEYNPAPLKVCSTLL